MLKSSKSGSIQKGESAGTSKKVAAKPVQHMARNAPAAAASKTEVKEGGNAGKGKPAAASGQSAVRAGGNSRPASRAQSTGNGEDRQEMIAIAAYYRAERRGFDGGDPLQDWLEAEAEINAAVYH